MYKTPLLMLVIAGLAYGLTLFFEHQTSRPLTQAKAIITPPDIPLEIYESPEQTPDFSFTSTDGTPHNISDFKGKTIILNFWASWCPPCIKEFPNLLKAAQNNPDDIALIALSSDLDEAAMNKFIKKMDIPKTNNIFIALDKDQTVTKEQFKVFKLPETLLIDTKQRVREKFIGADWNYEDLQDRLKVLQETQNNDS